MGRDRQCPDEHQSAGEEDAVTEDGPHKDDELREAPADPLLSERLDSPAQPEDVYLDEASPYRPIATGDIFRGVPVPGSTAEEQGFDLTMLVAHPSAMRQGPLLEDRAQAAPVLPIRGVRRSEWSPKYYDIFPLPKLAAVAKRNGFDLQHKPWAADLRLCGPIETKRLNLAKRVACLSEQGVILLLQRLVHTDTRAAIRYQTLHRVFAPKLEEIELLETWCETLVGPRVAEGADQGDELVAEAAAFDEYIQLPDARLGVSISELLADERRQSEGIRLVAVELRKRATSRHA